MKKHSKYALFLFFVCGIGMLHASGSFYDVTGLEGYEEWFCTVLSRSNDPNPEVRKEAAGALGSYAEPKHEHAAEVLTVLEKLSRDKDRFVRQAAAEALKKKVAAIPGYEARLFALLKSLSDDEYGFIRLASVEHLGDLL